MFVTRSVIFRLASPYPSGSVLVDFTNRADLTGDNLAVPFGVHRDT